MKDLFNAVLRLLVKIALRLYFNKIKVSGKENIPKNHPVILVANHQNALIDPLLLATHTNLKPWFLTRAAVFKNPMVSKILHYIRMLPVYRVRDGFSTIQQNQQTFEATFEVLKKNGTVVIFAEGSHSIVRNVRTLSKGFTRMAFGLKEKYPQLEPLILPVALEFSAHKKSGSLVIIDFGKPIPVDMPPSKSGLLTKKVQETLQSMVVEIPDEGYDENLQKILDAEVDVTSKKAVSEFLGKGNIIESVDRPSPIKNKLMKVFHFPLYWIWLSISPKIEDRVFESTFKFLIGFFLAPIYYLLLLILALESPLGSWALSFLIMAWISLLWNKNPQE
ncbi:acyl-phosphate glycerol 3-phosphate acyltransferase [Algoriphagus sp. NBT04N3]|jgi:1-acyl-sn-glycerol-3-phosphate acyltransferase|uniref:1-acyl-sn-glycerol-3-phosphate acyltransferase n=1 Tax=Algoriphagus sp. NBT04N3 TaxID=2705473 RepID=UPI001C62EF27|nr:1-acyl-sn-glycerol-3-phosphate acyltransferase [Algoriphagus sp. NBT04N3]QYH38430.1 acyl-phosphate glycerol 3-phosphate acyltransferase [Algoriphagus sp. NBT04N3]